MIGSLSEACGYLGMVGGQIKDINSNQIKDVESLDSMHSEKTGRLIQASIETAGILSGLSASDIESLKEYGGKIGLAFQIQDDIIDIESPASVSGKDQGSDIGKDKTTYPSLVGLEASKVRAQEFSNDAKKILQPINKNTDNLDKLADYIVTRKSLNREKFLDSIPTEEPISEILNRINEPEDLRNLQQSQIPLN